MSLTMVSTKLIELGTEADVFGSTVEAAASDPDSAVAGALVAVGSVISFMSDRTGFSE